MIHADGVVPVPWKNGGGVTRDLLFGPVAGDTTGWRWRLSLADIDRDGPFSPFPGVERWFAVVRGAGVRLRFAAREATLRAGDAPLVFDGADAPDCALIDGPTRDLNLMLRGGARGALARGRRFDAAWPQRWRFDLATLVLHPLPTGGAAVADADALWIGVAP